MPTLSLTVLFRVYILAYCSTAYSINLLAIDTRDFWHDLMNWIIKPFLLFVPLTNNKSSTGREIARGSGDARLRLVLLQSQDLILGGGGHEEEEGVAADSALSSYIDYILYKDSL